MREASKAILTEVHRMFAADGWVMVKTVPCLAYHAKRDTLCGFHGDDFYTEGEPSVLDELTTRSLSTSRLRSCRASGPVQLVTGRNCVGSLCGTRPASFSNPTQSTSKN